MSLVEKSFVSHRPNLWQARVRREPSAQAARVVFVHYCQHCLPCPEGIEIGWAIWDLDQVAAKGLEQIKEWYAEFPVKASACVECGVCLERCPFDVDILAKMNEAVALFEGESA